MRNLIRIASIYQMLFATLLASTLFLSLTAFPLAAFAATISTETNTLIPPGGTSCAPVSATQFTPYIYNGSLDSFEFTISDPSYVAVTASVAGNPVPLNFITRRLDSSGALRVHVDLSSTPVSGTLPIQVVLLAAPQGTQSVCLAVVDMTVGSGPIVSSVSTTPVSSTPTPTAAAPQPTATEQPFSSAPSASASGAENTAQTSTNAGASSSVATSAAAGPVVGSGPLCSSAAGAYQLWLILLIVYAIIVGVLLWAEFPVAAKWAQTPERIAAIVLALLVLILGFWYVAVPCRAALWMPLVAFLIAILGVVAAFWDHPKVTNFLLVIRR